MKLDLLTNATVVDDAIRFVFQKSKENLKSSNGSEADIEELNEPDYDEDKDQLEEEQDVKTGKIAATTLTTNQVF
jgi:hypothetical protein